MRYDNTAFQAIQCCHRHLNDHYVHLPKSVFNGSQMDFLVKNVSDGDISKLTQIVDARLERFVFVAGHECWGYPSPDDWTFNTYHKSVIPPGYLKLHERYAHKSYELFFKHRLNRHGMSLVFQKNIPLMHADGTMFLASQESRILVASPDSMPILTFTNLTRLTEWSISDFPIVCRPNIYLNNQRMHNLESELIQASSHGFLSELGLTADQITMCQLYAQNLKINDIAKSLNVRRTKIAFWNLRIKEIFHRNFSTSFKDAEECVRFLLMLKINF